MRDALAEAPASGSIWPAERQDAGGASGRRLDPRAIALTRHGLAGHPLLQYPRLRELAHSLSGSRHVRLAPRDATIGTPFKPLVEAEAGRTVAEAFASIDAL